MLEKYEDKIEFLSKEFEIDPKTFLNYIEENNLDVDIIIKALEDTDFSKEDVAELFNLDHTSLFNPFLFLVTELKDSTKNMNKVFKHLDLYNLKGEILTIYFGVANLINEDKEMLLPILKELLQRFDENLNSYIDDAYKGNLDNLALINKRLINTLKFKASSDIETQYTCSVDYNRKVINICLNKIFLEIAKANKEQYQLLKYSELNLVQGIHEKKIPFFEDLELYEQVVFDKIVEMVLTNHDVHYDEILELMNYFVFERDDSFSTNFVEKKDTDSTSQPVKKETKGETNKQTKNINLSYINLEKLLKDKIIGQDVVIEEIIKRIKVADFGVSKDAGAKAVFLLVGPTGVGKTEVVKLISKNIGDNSNNPNNLIRIDMSEYKEEHTVSKLLGAPPGYVGFDDREDNTVFDKIKAKPNAVILLDEIEKAHPEVLDVFLHIFDEGQATTNKQKKVDFSKNMIFMTSNIGSFEVKKNPMGFDNKSDRSQEKSQTYKKSLEKYLRPEFINRIDEILVFNELKKEEIAVIIDKQIKNIEKKITDTKQMEIKIEITPSALDYLLTKMEFNKYGAREVRRVLERFILSEIINLSIASNLKKGVLTVDSDMEKISFNYNETKVLRKNKKQM